MLGFTLFFAFKAIPSLTYTSLCGSVCIAKGGDEMAKYTLEDIMYGDKYGIESAVFVEVLRMVEQGTKAKEIREQLNILYVKHALLVAKKMHDEGDCISNNEITTAF